MNKILTLILIIFFTGCNSIPDKSVITSSLLVSSGNKKIDVLGIMGSPGDRQFSSGREVWQYCNTGKKSDDYVIIWFENDLVTELTSYKNRRAGKCSEFFKTINWENTPDKSIEIRYR